MPERICRWGILGTANIARKNWQGIRKSGNSTISAVASRDPAKAQAFINECQAAVPFPQAPAPCTYEDLLRREDVDAVYIPLPTGIRTEWVVRAANAGKHVLCEKPCGTNAAEVKAMIAACDKNGVQFMDGVMFMHGERLKAMRAVLDDVTTIGEVRRMATQFCFAGQGDFYSSNIRVSPELEPLGCLGDLGWYNVRFCLWIMGYQMPEKVSGRMIASHSGTVPTEFSGELLFADGVSASFYCSFRTENQQWAHVSGTKGSLMVRDFVVPFFGNESSFETNAPTLRVEGCSFHMRDRARQHSVFEYSDGESDAQETNMIRNFADLVLSGKLDPKWGEIALKTQRVLDACMNSAKAGGALQPVP